MQETFFKKLANAKHCLVCGSRPTDLNLKIYELSNKTLYSSFFPTEFHQSYSGITHGGAISAVLDELACRAYIPYFPEKLAMTGSLKVKFLKPVFTNCQHIALSKVLKINEKYFSAKSVIFNEKQEKCAEAEGIFIFVEPQKINTVSKNGHQIGEQSETDFKEKNQRVLIFDF